MGMVWWMVDQNEEKMKTVTSAREIKNTKKSTENTMNKFLGALSIPQSQWDTPLEWRYSQSDLSLANPYSAVSCWLLYLYSMELGSPPLYLELNRAAREMDKTKLPQLGPFAAALGWVCNGAEEYKKKEDKIVPGRDIGGALAGCFLLFRGTAMKQDWIGDYLKNVGNEVHPGGSNSYSRNLTTALKFAFKDQAQDKKPVLFLLLQRNHRGVGSVMMNGEAYSSYPSEGEMLLLEGVPVTILGFDSEVEVLNKHESFKNFFQKKLMVLYLFLKDG